jgi:uncharacterized protein
MNDSETLRDEIPYEVAEKLGRYVYLYVHPDDRKIFYVGKGIGQRALSHLSHEAETRKVETIRALAAEGKKPVIEILAHNLPNDETALRIEAAVIDVLGLDSLTNLIRGHDSLTFGRLPLEEINARYGAREVEIHHPAILIRVNKLYRPGMNEEEVLEITRGIWKIGPRREKVRYALAVYHGVVREVFEILSWHPAGTTAYRKRSFTPDRCVGRWEFQGRVADEAVRAEYKGGRVSGYLSEHSQNPISYVTT